MLNATTLVYNKSNLSEKGKGGSNPPRSTMAFKERKGSRPRYYVILFKEHGVIKGYSDFGSSFYGVRIYTEPPERFFDPKKRKTYDKNAFITRVNSKDCPIVVDLKADYKKSPRNKHFSQKMSKEE